MLTGDTEDKHMTVDDLLYDLEDYIAASQRIPMTKIIMLDESRLNEYIELIRQAIVEDSADNMRVAATFRQVSPSFANDPDVQAAQQEADEIRASADAYAEAVLTDIKTRLERLSLSVEAGLKDLKR